MTGSKDAASATFKVRTVQLKVHEFVHVFHDKHVGVEHN